MPHNVLKQHFTAESESTTLCLHQPSLSYANECTMTNTSWSVVYAAGRYNSCISCRADWKLLLPLMHLNLSNIVWTWVTSTIVSWSFHYSATQILLHNHYHYQTMEIPLSAHTINVPIIHLPSTHSFMQQNIKPCLNQKNAQTLQENSNKRNVQHTIKHPKKVN